MPTLVNNLRAIRGPVTAVPVTAGSGIEIDADTQNNQIVISANLEAGSGIEIVDDNGKAKIINSDNAQALPIVAGAGVKLSVVNNQVVVSADETVLYTYTGNAYDSSRTSITFSESCRNFERIRVYLANNDYATDVKEFDPAVQGSTVTFEVDTISNEPKLYVKLSNWVVSDTALTLRGRAQYMINDASTALSGCVVNKTSTPNVVPYKVVGINRIANN